MKHVSYMMSVYVPFIHLNKKNAPVFQFLDCLWITYCMTSNDMYLNISAYLYSSE